MLWAGYFPAQKEFPVSLKVSPELLSRAASGPVDDAVFLDCIQESLPYAWKVISRVVAELEEVSGADFVDDNTAPPTDEDQGQLLRLMASDPMRAAVERQLGVKLAFQNCCRVAVFRPTAVGGAAYQEFMSPRGQLLNQSPELTNC